MPTYDYECPKGHTFEVFQKMTAKPVAKCPKCGAKARRKISGGAGFLFKGEGFYITDYRSDDYKKKASSEAVESAPKEESSKGGEQKSAEKAEEKVRAQSAKRPASSAKSTKKPARATGSERAAKASGAKRPKKPSGR